MEALWNEIDLVQCITLTSRPERRRAAEAQFAAVGLADRVQWLEQAKDTQSRLAHGPPPT